MRVPSILIACVATLLATQPAEAQRRNSVPDSIRRIQSVEPLSGPPGTIVHVHTENLPIQARIHVGVGARHIGFEALTEVQQGEWGDVTAELPIPEYWTWDRPLVLIIFNGIFSPIGLSEPFHVTNAAGEVQRTGRVADEGGPCLGFRDQDDYFYALSGDVEGFSPGDDLTVEGVLVDPTRCGQTTILVKRLVSPGS